MKKNSIKTWVFVFLLTMSCAPLFARAQAVNTSPDSPCPSGQVCITNPFKGGNNLTDFITVVLNNVVMPIAALVAVVYIIWAGFSYVTAQGKPAEIEKAHQRLLWALVGTGILLGAAGISLVIQNTVQTLIAH